MSLTSDLQTALTTLMGATQTSAAAAAAAWANALGAITSWGSSATIPLKVVCPAYLSAGDVSANFDGTGLGITARWLGWAICNGNNGTPNLNNVFPRWSTVVAGTTGGEDTNSHTHSTPAGTSGSTAADLATHAHAIQQTSTNATPVGFGGTAGPYTVVNLHEDNNNSTGGFAQFVTGSTGTGGGHTHTTPAGTSGAPSDTENRPAFNSIVPVMRIT